MPSAQVLHALRERRAFHMLSRPTPRALRSVYQIAWKPPPDFLIDYLRLTNNKGMVARMGIGNR